MTNATFLLGVVEEINKVSFMISTLVDPKHILASHLFDVDVENRLKKLAQDIQDGKSLNVTNQ